MTSSLSAKPLSVAFVGLGNMGFHMAAHLQDKGHALHVFNRSAAKAEPLLAKGATWHGSAGEAAAQADVTITIVGLPSDVEEVYFSPKGIINRAPKGAILIDMTTSSPSLAVKIAAEAARHGLAALDAPVSGGELAARDAKLSIMVGGEKATFERALPVFEAMGTNIRFQGAAGAGQHTKMANQIVIASTMLGVCEGLTYAIKAGLDPHEVLRSIGTGAAGGFLLNNLGPKILDQDYRPGFFIEHFIKDMTIALAESKDMALTLEGLALSLKSYRDVADHGFGREGTQALIRHYL